MKKIIKFLFILMILLALGYFIYINYIKENIPIIKTEEEKVAVEEYYVYGNHLNIKGNLEILDTEYEKISLILYNGEEKEIDIISDTEDNKIMFNTSENVNEGIYMDNLDRGIYYFFLKLTYPNEEDKENPINKYYILNNKTKHKETTYYTLSKYNNKIEINSNNDYQTLSLNIIENKDDNIYDITIDPGHGGMDSGALNGKYKESEFTMSISSKIKKYLEQENITVKMTHEKKDLTDNETLDEYNEHGRAVIPNEVKSKYTLSIHINTNNSSNVKGVEVYTPDNINYDFATKLADSIVDSTDLTYSTNKLYKVEDGVYTHNFTESEIKSSNQTAKEKNRNTYDITTNSNYLYMIRETGGYLTGAYVDDRNISKIGQNPYYDSNIGNETYLIEVAYMSNQNDLNILSSSEDKIAKSISQSIIEELAKE